MTRSKPSAKQSGPTTKEGRQMVYDREICISICRRFLEGEDLQAICAKPPMPIAPIFLDWVQQHQEAGEIYHCAEKFRSDRTLAKILDLPWDTPVGEWEKEVRAKLERGYPVDYIDRKYTAPDWENKVYPLIGRPPVWSTERIQAYDNLLNEFTRMLKPCDLMELIWTKEAADATWEAAREAREKNAVPHSHYRDRCIALAKAQRQSCIEIKPATARDHSRGLRAGFKYHQGLDAAQSRKMKRRDDALRQIERWRDGLGGKAQVLSDKFVAEQALAQRYGVDQIPGQAETHDTSGEAIEPGPPLVPSDETQRAPASAGEVPPPPMDATAGGASPGETAKAPPAPAGEAAEAAGGAAAAAPLACASEPALAPAYDGAAKAVSPPAAAGEVAQPTPCVGSAGETAEAARPLAQPDEAADAAPRRAAAGEVEIDLDGVTERINWIAWLTGAQRYPSHWLIKAGEKAFKRPFTSKCALLRKLVLECKMIPPDQLCPELALLVGKLEPRRMPRPAPWEDRE
jgi:hypothetical protein